MNWLLDALFVTALCCVPAAAGADTLLGSAAYGDWRTDVPGLRRHLTASDVPPPYATRSASNTPSVGDPPKGALPRVLPGFQVQVFAAGLTGPRLLRAAPNGDIFVAETESDRVRVLRPRADGTAQDMGVFASANGPFGIAFYPPGPNPSFVYVAELNRVVRFPYAVGDTSARAAAQTIVAELAPSTGGHTTRDVAFSPDGQRMFVSVGSGSNIAQGMPRKTAGDIAAWEATHGRGAGWGDEAWRADVLVFHPDGSDRRAWATGIRNCVGLAIDPVGGEPWCATNERDGLGDNIPPDYITRVPENSYFGWPWYYIGGNEDPRHKGERPDLAGASAMPDVLIQPHSAPLQIGFYPPDQRGAAAFPLAYRGDAFVALHGSWNRTTRTGYKVVRIPRHGGVATGEYEDFLTGLVTDDTTVWGRPVGVAVGADGALLVSDDVNGTIWRVAPVK